MEVCSIQTLLSGLLNYVYLPTCLKSWDQFLFHSQAHLYSNCFQKIKKKHPTIKPNLCKPHWWLKHHRIVICPFIFLWYSVYNYIGWAATGNTASFFILFCFALFYFIYIVLPFFIVIRYGISVIPLGVLLYLLYALILSQVVHFFFIGDKFFLPSAPHPEILPFISFKMFCPSEQCTVKDLYICSFCSSFLPDMPRFCILSFPLHFKTFFGHSFSIDL